MQSTSIDARLVREARLALTVVAALLTAVALLGYRYVSSFAPDQGVPPHVMQAPPAEEVDATFIAEATARRMRAKADPSRAAREYHSNLLPTDDPVRVAARNQDWDRSVLQGLGGDSQNQEMNAPRRAPASPGSTAPVGEFRESTPIAAPIPENSPAESTSPLDFQPMTFHQQPLVPPRLQPNTGPELREDEATQRRNLWQPDDNQSNHLRLPDLQATSWDVVQRTTATEMRSPRDEAFDAPAERSLPTIETSLAPSMEDPSQPQTTGTVVDADEARLVPDQTLTRLVVRSDQSLWPIAEMLYGDGKWFRALYRHNERLYTTAEPGAEISLECPSRETLERMYAELAPEADRQTFVIAVRGRPVEPFEFGDGLWYTVRPSDTLFDIARQELGQAGRFAEILECNRERLPQDVNHLSRLPVGLQLRLPPRTMR